MSATATHEQVSRLELKVGDVVITKDSETADDIGIPAHVSETKEGLVCAYHLAIVRPDKGKIDSKFLYWNLMSDHATSYWEQHANGVTRFSIPSQTINSLRIPLPNLATQRRIADRLDRETGEIDSLAKELDEYVGLLDKRFQLFLSRTFDYSVLPKSPLFTWGTIQSGASITSDDIEVEGTYPVYGGNGLRGYCESANQESDRVLIGRQGALCGNVHLAKAPFFASEHALVFTPTRPVNLHWLKFALKNLDLGRLSQASAQPGINATEVSRQRIPEMSVEVQKEVADELQHESRLKDTLISECTALKELLLKRRQVLITDMVTGKVEV